MNRSSQRGIALVITLLMLSVVTLMSVVFLAISQREKASVTVTADLTSSKFITDAALARAQGEIVSRMLAATNAFAFDYLVSTNFLNPGGFRAGVSSVTNVSYHYPDGRPLDEDDLLLNLANLQYDARVPVFIPTNDLGGNDFRFYLDFNRNGLFETNGFLPVLGQLPGQFFDTNGNPLTVTRSGNVLSNHFVGDPEWIGVLERPDFPHSETNRFVGRYAYLALPAGRSLDLNFIHNYAKRHLDMSPTQLQDSYSRNQGVGSWEINLAAFLVGLNTNSWPLFGGGAYGYDLRPTLPNRGFAFDDAHTFIRRRYLTNLNNLSSVNALFDPLKAAFFASDRIDEYSNDDLSIPPGSRIPENDLTHLAWAGSPNPAAYFDAQELYDVNRTSLPFVNRLRSPMTNSLASYDRYTFYRLLGQIGTDSRPAESNYLFRADYRRYPSSKIHLHYTNLLTTVTNTLPWAPTDWFYQTADRLIRSSLWTNIFTNQLGGLVTNFFLGETPVRPNFSVTNIQLANFAPGNQAFYVTNNEYSTALHRLLQLAANIYDASTNRPFGSTNDYPTVFRPIFGRTATNVYIAGFSEVVDARILDSAVFNWRDLQNPLDRAAIQPNDHVFGVPWVIGAKKGYPNFNEFTMQTVAQVSRKLEVRKPATNAVPNMTNQMYVLGVSNLFGIEGWNSYTQDFRRNFELRVTNRYSIVLSHVVGGFTNQLLILNRQLGNTISSDIWPGNTNVTSFNPSSFLLPLQTNVIFFTNSVYVSGPPYLIPGYSNIFERTFNVPQWILHVTNRLQYILIDRSVAVPRVVDFVNLDRMVGEINVNRRLAGDTNAGGGGFFSDSTRFNTLTEDDLWITNRLSPNNPLSPPLGLLNQIAVAMGDTTVSDAFWRDYSADPISGGDKDKAIAGIREFFRQNSTNQSVALQVPFSPTRKIFHRKSWQANDPLVHYTLGDLVNPLQPDDTNDFAVIRPPNAPIPVSNLGVLNFRYRPWGGNPGKQDPALDYNLAFKDPLIRRSDDWLFPTNRLPNVGSLGRVHRGTPWQTLYLKSTMADLPSWQGWSGSFGTHPTNDWRLLDVFTAAPNANAARGLLSVNQSGVAAWSAVLGGVQLLSNSVANQNLPRTPATFTEVYVTPGTPQVTAIVNGINRTRTLLGGFRDMGSVLATPELSVNSPYLNHTPARQQTYGLTDQAYERIPQQIMSLLKADEPRIVVYSFGQSLKPAERSLTTAGAFYNLCTNYQVTGEVVTKTVLRFEDAPHRPRAIIESYHVVPPE